MTTLLLDLLLLTATADDVKLWRVGALMVSLVLVTIGALTTKGTPRSRLALRFVIAATVPFCLVVGVRLLGGDLPWFKVFGPVDRGRERRDRSPAEGVEALADTALELIWPSPPEPTPPH